MFSRFFWMSFAVLLIVAVVSISAEKSEEDIEYDESALDSIEDRSKFGKKVEKILRKFFKHINEHCIKKAVEKCKKHWYNPSKVIQCAKDLFSLEGALCLIS